MNVSFSASFLPTIKKNNNRSVNLKPAIDTISFRGTSNNFTEVRASHILTHTYEKALRVKNEILAGKSFEQAAREHSVCPSKANGGDLDYFKKGMMVRQFEEVAFDPNLPVGQVSEPIQTNFGWHLIKVVDRR